MQCHYTRVHLTVWYSHFTISSPDCTLHTAITHVIKALESHMNTDDVWHVRLYYFQYHYHVSECNVQSGLEIVK